MIVDPTTLYLPVVLAGAFFMVLGAVFGLIAANMINSKERRSAAPHYANEKTSMVHQPPGLAEAARLWREQSTGKLVIEVNGQVFRSRSEINQKLLDGLAQLQRDYRAWLGINEDDLNLPGDPNRPVEASGVVGNAQPAAESPGAAAAAPSSWRSVPSPVGSAAPITEPASGVKPVSTNIADVVNWAIRAPAKKDAALPTSMVGQIDVIMQDKLLNSPWSDRGIRLVETAGGGMVVVVGGDRYDSVADVPDPQIRALIQMCVAEWEKRNYPA